MRLDPRDYLLLFLLMLLAGIVVLILRDNVDVNVEADEAMVATAASSPLMFVLDDKSDMTTTTVPTTTTIAPTTTIPPTTTTLPPPTTTVPPVTDRGVDWDAIAQCESDGDWHINTGNGYYGGLQFHHKTWHAYGGGRFSENAHLTSRENQILVASGMSLSHWPNCGKYG